MNRSLKKSISAPQFHGLPKIAKQTTKRAFKDGKSGLNTKQAAALQLLQREELNAKRSRLESLLTQQFIGKYGSKQRSSRINQFIRATCSDFVHSYTNMTVAESMVSSLESQIKEITAKMRTEITNLKQEARKIAHEKQNGVNFDSKVNKTESFQSSMSQSGNIDPDWAVLNALKVAEGEERAIREKEEVEARRAKYRRELDAQRDTLRSKANNADLDKQIEHEKNVRAALEHEAEQRNLKTKRQENGKREREMRWKQIQENNARRDQEKQLKIMQEKADMARSRRLAESEAQSLLNKKELEKARNERVKAENEANKRLKAEAQRKQWEYEAKLNKDYEEKMAREEAAREAALQARVDDQKRRERKFQALADESSSAEEEAYRRTMAEIQKKLDADDEKQRKKEHDRVTEIKKSREFNLTLIERKKQIKEEERKADIERRKLQQQQLEDQENNEKMKKEKKKLAMLEMKRQLDQQVTYRSRITAEAKAGLSKEELMLNKSLIAKIESNPELYRKVMEKVSPNPKGGLGDFAYA